MQACFCCGHLFTMDTFVSVSYTVITGDTVFMLTS